MSETTPHEPEPGSAPEASSAPEPHWERALLSRLAFASLVEQRRARRWGIAFKFAMLGYLVVLLLIYVPFDWSLGIQGERHTALVDVRGVIADDGNASADRIVGGLRAAFEDEDTVGVILRINSPGGSPVQAGYVNDEIVRLRAKYPDIPLYAVISDMCASGGYFIAAAADKIYANKASLVGSIGVLMNGFGFVHAMEKLGVERRLLTAGEHKGFLDPFSPTNPEDVAHIEGLLKRIHQQFIDTVRRGRGERLAENDDLFSGLVWTGEESIKLGLVDAIGSSGYVAREVIGAEDIVNFTVGKSYLDMLADRLGTWFARTSLTEIGWPRLQ